jgi:hypothetical protein
MAWNGILGSIGESVIKTPLAKSAAKAGTALLGGGGVKVRDNVSVSGGLLGIAGFTSSLATSKAGKGKPDFWSLALSAQTKFDQDKDGHLTDDEVEKALGRKNLPIDQKATLETLRGKQDGLEELHNDEFGDENDGTTREDLLAMKNSKSQDARLMAEQFGVEKGLAADKKKPSTDRPADLTSKIGSRDYYIERYKDFRRRNPDKAAPPYYMYYGIKYFDRFQALKPDVQPETRDWIDKTARKLHEKIEQRNSGASFAELERNHEEFKQFAYESHPSAYLEGGLKNVPVQDLAKIPFVPDSDDLLSVDGVIQAGKTGVGYASDLLEGTWDDVKSWFD